MIAVAPERIEAAVAASGRCHDCNRPLDGTVWRVREREDNGGVPWHFYCGLHAPDGVDWAVAAPCECCSRMVRQPKATPPSTFVSCSPACRAVGRLPRMRVEHAPRLCAGCLREFTPTRADQRFHSKACALSSWKCKHKPCPVCGSDWIADPDDPDSLSCLHGGHSLPHNGSRA
jgi:hypothetical protein